MVHGVGESGGTRDHMQQERPAIVLMATISSMAPKRSRTASPRHGGRDAGPQPDQLLGSV